jgi:serine/alanine adding enzyme
MSKASVKPLKLAIKKLKAERGILSKAVGEAKQQGHPIDGLIKQVKNLSEQIKALESELKSHVQHEASDNKPNHLKLPSQFRQRKLVQTNTPLTIVNRPSDQDWDQYVDEHPNATIYHSTAIKRVIEHTFGHSSHYLAAVDQKHSIHGVLPLIEMKSRLFGHFLISLPFFNYGGLLVSSAQAEQCLLTHASELAKNTGAQHIEYRHTHNELNLPSRSEKVTMLLNLPDSSETLWNDIGTKVRAQIKKAKRFGLNCKQGREELINDFYEVFSRNMRDLGTPVYAKNLFINMLKHLPEAWITIIYHNHTPVSCGFLLGWRDTLEIPWASTLKQANQFDANMLLYWEILQSAIKKGYEIFDFGRSSKLAPTYRFKKQWGTKPHDMYWHYWLPNQQPLPELNPNNPKFRVMVEAWKRLPLPVSNFIGPYVVKSIP